MQGLNQKNINPSAAFTDLSTVRSFDEGSIQATLQDWKVGKIDPELIAELRKKPCYFEIAPLFRYEITPFQYEIIPTSFTGKADPSEFAEHLTDKSQPVKVFQSFSGNLLVTPTDTEKDYHHLQTFLNSASSEEIRSFFRSWAEAADTLLANNDVVWLSTHGKGIPWLHGRVDLRPQYYSTRKFKENDPKLFSRFS